MLQYDWLWSGHMIIKKMFYIPIKLKPELAHASMTTNKIHNEKFNYIKFWCDLNVIIKIECIFL
jgi:hypothetical protein